VSLEDITGMDVDHAVFPRSPGAQAIVLKAVTGLTIRDSAGLPEYTRPKQVASGTL
jgi:hypothetical protein